MQTFTTIELVLLFVTVGYGLRFGIINIISSLVGLFVGESTQQSQLGKILDVLFYAAIGYLTYTYFGFTI